MIRKAALSIFISFLIALSLNAQSPQLISYQGIVRDLNDQAVTNSNINISLLILKSSANGDIVFEESHTTQTNQAGLFTILIGGGSNIAGSLSEIPWSESTYFLKSEIDIDSDGSTDISNTTQLLSVPYALYAEKSGNSLPGPKGDKGDPGDKGSTGEDGVSIVSSSISNGTSPINGQIYPSGSLILVLSNGTSINTGIAKGDQGEKGESGIPGIPGEKGTSIISSTISDGTLINGETYPLGSLVFELSDGSFINAGLVKGSKGDEGERGIQGIQGEQGVQGNPGKDGVSIVYFNISDGTTPVNDSVFPAGNLIITLSDGSSVDVGFIKGEQGERGLQGNPGENGSDGISITSSSISDGSTLINGKNFPIGHLIVTLSDGTSIDTGLVKGDKGDQGERGVQGEQGIQGIQGEKGQVGVGIVSSSISDGSTPINGQIYQLGNLVLTLSDGSSINAGFVKGDQGERGERGERGIRGEQGIQGNSGSDGKDGVAITSTNISDGSTPINGSVFPFGNLIIGLSDGSTIDAGFVKGDQGLRGIQGEQGIQGVSGKDGISITSGKVSNGFTPINGTIFDEGDLILTLSNGSSINAGFIKGDQGEKGDKGDTGEKGLQGDQGLQGLQGDPGDDGQDGISITSSTISDGSTPINGQTFPADNLILTLSDGSLTNAGYVKGNKGDKGDQGERGEQGLQGNPGENGEDGLSIVNTTISDGSTPINGRIFPEDNLILTFSDGSLTNVGYVKGDQGDKGDKGERGLRGFRGAPGTGLTVVDNGDNMLSVLAGIDWNGNDANASDEYIEGGNIFIGNGVGQFNGTGVTYSGDASWNTVIGMGGTFTSNTLGRFNTAFGAFTLSENTIGRENTAIGASALTNNTTAQGNTAIGFEALYDTQFGDGNTAVGAHALRKNTFTGNTAIGSGALYNSVTGNFNVALGNNAGYYETGNNKLHIANGPNEVNNPSLIYGEFDNRILEFNAKVNIKDVINLNPRDSAPQTPSKGDLYFDSTINKIKMFNGTTWETLQSN